MVAPLVLAGATALASEFLPGAVRWLTGSDKAAAAAETVVGLARQVTGTETPAAAAATLRADPAQVIELQRLWNAHEIELYRAENARLEIVNETFRREVASADPYVRRWRPTFGYAAAATWTIQGVIVFFVLGWVIIVNPENLAAALSGIKDVMAALADHWLYAMIVLGVSVASRSGDKRVAANAPPGPLASLVGRLTGR